MNDTIKINDQEAFWPKQLLAGAAIIVLSLYTLAPLPVTATETKDSTTGTTTEETTTDTSTKTTSDDSGSTSGDSTKTNDSTDGTKTTDKTGPTEPTGADGDTYTYNKEKGYWENDYYIWYPDTNQTKPKGDVNYSYNQETGRWDTKEWIYSPEQGKYIKNPDYQEPSTTNKTSDPKTATKSSTGDSGSSGGSDTTTSSLPGAYSGDGGGLKVSDTGPDSSNTIENTNESDGFFDLYHNVNISNTLNQNAQSGDASVLGNTTAGSALTGDATNTANLINLLQSSWLPEDGKLSTFEANLFGDIYGDLLINNTGPDSSNNINDQNDTDLKVNATTDASINNELNLTSTSGDATVAGNTTGGDATTGDASATANILNLINSTIKSSQSFFGTLNIMGNLVGDILLPKAQLNKLIASNTGPGSDNTIDQSNNTNIEGNFETNQSITNNVNSSAESGDATVSGNTTGGSATTGDASNELTILNLAGQDIVGTNSLLVFVNVYGSWMGLIMDAPKSSNAAILGSGTESTNRINSENNVDAEVNAERNLSINNDLNLNAKSGDANVTHNTTGGDATSGDASTRANIFNATGSTFSLTDWFGVLFVNVFGDWQGSFGVDTPFGDLPGGSGGDDSKPDLSNNTGGRGGNPGSSTVAFQPSSDAGGQQATSGTFTSNDHSTVAYVGDSGQSGTSDESDSGEALSTSTTETGAETAAAADDVRNDWLPLYIGAGLAILLLGAERLWAYLKAQGIVS